MAQELPTSFSLKSQINNKFLAYIKEGEVQGLLKPSAEDVNPLTVFQAEKAKSGDGLVHLKSSYNNKYLRRLDQNKWWIAAAADKPEEDQSNWSCTLFKPVFVGGDGKTIQLIHVQLRHYVRPWTMYEPFQLCLFAAEKGPDKEKQDIFTIDVPGSAVPGPDVPGPDVPGPDAPGPDAGDADNNVDFDFSNGFEKIYDQSTVTLATGIANNVADAEQVMQVVLDYNMKESSTWKSSSSSSSNTNRVSNIKSAIPVIFNGRVQLSGNVFSGPYEWGTTVETTYKNVKTTYKVVAPPKTRVIVTLKATKASFDVEFTLKGSESTQKKKDGVFTGVNLYNLKYETEQRKIDNV